MPRSGKVGVSVLYLTNESIANGLNAYWILVLVIELICGQFVLDVRTER